jgi:cellulose synthase/poly-beta-1,6-N-acetylglucosamine synthase-like glycosyltransferase
MVILITIAALVSCLAYVILIASYCYAWVKMKTPVFSGELLPTKVSIIIAARNEEFVIENCIHAILLQTYPPKYIEIILVDDASEDATNDIIQRFCNKYQNIKLITLKSDGNTLGKKNALTAGIHQSTGELIVTTDADCVMNTNWLKTIVAYYQQTQVKMIVAPVLFHNEKNVFEKMQTLEFMSLIVSGGASLHYNKAIMCNGANLAYPRTVFDEVNGFENVNNKASGDDVLLMYKIKKEYKDGVMFLKHQDAMVYTTAKNNLMDFVNQRKRWASKGFKSLNNETQKVAVVVYLFNVSLLILMLLAFFNFSCFGYFSSTKFFLLLLTLKCVIDFLLLFLASSFFKKKVDLFYFLIEEFLYVFYSVFIGLSGLLTKYEWKGRKTK